MRRCPPRYRDRQFHNSEPSSTLVPGTDVGMFKSMATRGSTGRPRQPIPLATPLAPAAAGDAAVTWYGHSSVLVEVDGYRVLADPVWSERVSPSATVGPARMHPPTPVALTELPAVDAIVISHDHYDHLDMATVKTLTRTQTAPFVVPIGIGAHLRHWKVPENRIVELDWDESTKIGDLVLTCTEARHFSGRGLVRNTTQWASWVFAGPKHRVFFGGDSGYTSRFEQLGETYGPFDLTLLPPVGAYDVRWPDIHMNPEEAVQTHIDLNKGDGSRGVFVPIHWRRSTSRFTRGRSRSFASTSRLQMRAQQCRSRCRAAGSTRCHRHRRRSGGYRWAERRSVADVVACRVAP